MEKAEIRTRVHSEVGNETADDGTGRASTGDNREMTQRQQAIHSVDRPV